MSKSAELGAACLLAFLGVATLPAAAQDAAAGEKVFKVQCMACHSVVPGKKSIGPNLQGVIGRAAGSRSISAESSCFLSSVEPDHTATDIPESSALKQGIRNPSDPQL